MNTPNNHSKESGFSGLGNTPAPAADDLSQAFKTPVSTVNSSNPYASAYASQNEVNLDSGSPELVSSTSRGVNKKAIGFVLGLGSLLVLGIAWALSSYFSGSNTAKQEPPKEEVVKIPDAPASTLSGTAPTNPTAPSAPTSEEPPIPVVKNNLPPPPVMVQPTQTTPVIQTQAPVIDPYVEQRRQAGTIVNAVNSSGSNNNESDTERGTATLIRNAENLLVRGTYIRCVLETKIVTDVPGFASCVITEPVYSMNGRKLLLAKGSKVSGRYQQSEVDGPRIAVIWDRITTPNGYDVRIQSPGVDNLGGAGHIGDYKSHWPSRIASALLVSLIGDSFKYAAAKYGPESTTTTSTSTTQSPYDSATAKTLEGAATNALARAARRPATVTINQGSLLNIYTSRDIDFSGVLSQ